MRGDVVRPGVWNIAALYLALSLAFCWPLFAQPLANGAGDWDQHTLWYAAFLRDLAFGSAPFWNPWYCGGNVLWANPQASLVSPVYLLALVMPLTLAMKVNVVGHYIAGFAGMHLILRRIIGVRGLVATVYLSSLFVFSGAMALHTAAGHSVYLPVFFFPLIVYCFWRATAGEWRLAAVAAGIVGFSILNGGMHVMPLVAVLLGSLAVGALIAARTITPVVLAVSIVALGCVYAAPRVVPALSFIHSESFRDMRPERERDRMSLEMLRVSFFDSSQPVRPKVTPGVQLYGWQEYGNYLGWFGGLIMLLGFGWIAIARHGREHWRELSVAATLVIALLLTAGDFVPHAPASLLRDLPMFESFRIPSRFTMLVPLAGALAAAFAVRALEARVRAQHWRFVSTLVCLAGLIQLAFVNRQHFYGVFVLPVENQSRLFDRVTPEIQMDEVTSPGPRVPRTFMLDTMLAGASSLTCYEPLRVRRTASTGRVEIIGQGSVTLTDQQFSPNRVSAMATVGAEPARIALNQNFAEGWSSSLGPVQRDPRGGRPSVVLPAGFSGPVSFSFFPPGLWVGLLVCVVGVGFSALAYKRWR